MLLYFSGRKGAGKSTCANVLVDNYNFKRFSFADKLKEGCSKVFSLPIKDMYSQESKERSFAAAINLQDYQQELQNEFDIDLSVITWSQIPKIKSIRELLQVVGTEIIRYCDKDYHVRETIKRLDPHQRWVCEDVRFPNEKIALDAIGAVGVFIIRVRNFEISNHASEIALNWTHFDRIIFNYKSIKYLEKKTKSLYKLLTTSESASIAKQYTSASYWNSLLETKPTSEIAENLGLTRDSVVWWCNRNCVHIPITKYQYNEKSFLDPTPEAAYLAGVLSADGCITNSGRSKTTCVLKLTMKDKDCVEKLQAFCGTNKPIYSRPPYYDIAIASQKIIENLKLWNLKPQKTMKDEVPFYIKTYPSLIPYWFLGLLDGDGTVYIGTFFTIRLLASFEICNHIIQYYPSIVFKLRLHYAPNLYQLDCHGQNAAALYTSLPWQQYGMKRKWEAKKDQIQNYLLTTKPRGSRFSKNTVVVPNNFLKATTMCHGYSEMET